MNHRLLQKARKGSDLCEACFEEVQRALAQQVNANWAAQQATVQRVDAQQGVGSRLLVCSDCGQGYSRDVNQCPHCGHRRRAALPVQICAGSGTVIGALVAVCLGMWPFGNDAALIVYIVIVLGGTSLGALVGMVLNGGSFYGPKG